MVLVAISVAATGQAIPPPPPPTGPPPPPIPALPPGSNAPIPPGAYVITATPTTIKSGIQTNVSFTVFYDNQPVRDVQVFYSGITQTISCGSNYANCSTGTTDENGTVTLSVKAPGSCPAEIDCDKISISANTYGHYGVTELTVIHPPIDIIEQVLINIATDIIIFFAIILSPPLIQFLAIILIPFFLAKRYLKRIEAKYGNLFDDNLIIPLIPYTILFSIFWILSSYAVTTELTTGILSQNSNLFNGPLRILIYIILYVLPVFITVLSLLLTKSIATKLNLRNWRVLFGSAGVALSLISFALITHMVNLTTFEFLRPEIILLIIGAATGLTLLIYSVGRHFSISLLTNKLNASIIWAYILNVLSIFAWMEIVRQISLDYFIPVFIETGGYNWMYLSLPILWILNTRFMNSDNFRNLLKLIIIYIGLAPAMRIFLGL